MFKNKTEKLITLNSDKDPVGSGIVPEGGSLCRRKGDS